MWNKITLGFWSILDSWFGKAILLIVGTIIGLFVLFCIVYFLAHVLEMIATSPQVASWFDKPVSDLKVQDLVILSALLAILIRLFGKG